jgi:hypothetical protein
MIKHPDIDHTWRVDQSARDELIGLGRLCDSGGMRMTEDHSGRVQNAGPP